MTEEQKPEGTKFTLIVPLDREKSKSAVYHISDMSEEVYMGLRKLVDSGKTFDGVRMAIKALQVGGDSIELLRNNLVAIASASKLMEQLFEPVDGELKKN